MAHAMHLHRFLDLISCARGQRKALGVVAAAPRHQPQPERSEPSRICPLICLVALTAQFPGVVNFTCYGLTLASKPVSTLINLETRQPAFALAAIG